MEMLIKIIVIAALIGGAVAYFSGNKSKEDAAAGAAVGAMYAGGCIIQLLIYGFIAMVGIWLFSAVFG
jgi:hypothetical protein